MSTGDSGSINHAKLDKIVTAYRRLLEVSPGDVRARLQVARALRLLGRVDESVVEYWYLAHLLLQHQDVVGAINACKSILELQPYNLPTQQALTALLAQQQAVFGVAGPEAATPAAWGPVVPGRVGSVGPPGPASEPQREDRPTQPVLRSAPPAPAPGPPPPQGPGATTCPLVPVVGSPGPLVEPDDELPPPLPEAANSAEPLPPPPPPHWGVAGAGTPPPPPPPLDGRWGYINAQMNRESTGQLDLFLSNPELRAMGPRAPGPLNEPRARALADIPLFRILDVESIVGLLPTMRRPWVDTGDVILAEGEPVSFLYLVASGRVGCYHEAAGREPTTLGELGVGSFFGEQALLGGGWAPATYRAREETELLVFPAEALKGLAERFPRLEKVARSYASARRQAARIGACAVFRDLPLPVREELRVAMRPMHCQVGEVVVPLGQRDPPLMVVVSGQLQLCESPEGAAPGIRRGPGDAVAVSWAANNTPADLHVTAASVSELLCLPGTAFRRQIDLHPVVAEATQRIIKVRRLIGAKQKP